MSPQLSAEEKNAHMRRERETLRQLLQAAQSHDFPTLRAVVEEYIHRNHSELSIVEVLSQFRDARKRTALHFACQPNTETNEDAPEKDIVEQILEWILQDEEEGTKKKKKHEAIQKLLRLKDSEGMTPLMLAAQSPNRLVPVRALIAADQSTNGTGTKSTLGLARSNAGATALHYAAASPHAAPETIRAIHHAGPVALHTFTTSGGTPLHWACMTSATDDVAVQRREAVLQTLLDLGADINARREDSGGTVLPPLFVLLATANDRLTHFLLTQHGPRHNLQPSLDFVLAPVMATPLHMAADLHLLRSLQWLIRYYKERDDAARADTTTTTTASYISAFARLDGEGLTALDVAVKEQHVECVQMLLNATAKEGTTYSLADAQAYIANWTPRPAAAAAASEPVPERSLDEAHVQDVSATEEQAKQDASQILLQRDAMAPENAPGSTDAQQAAQTHKSKGNQFFAEQKWELAVEEYTQAIAWQPHEATLYSNRSAAYTAWSGHADAALYDAVLAQTLQPTWPKAFYRVAVARLALQRYEDAAVAAWEGLKLDPENAEFKELLQKCVHKGRREHQKKAQK